MKFLFPSVKEQLVQNVRHTEVREGPYTVLSYPCIIFGVNLCLCDLRIIMVFFFISCCINNLLTSVALFFSTANFAPLVLF